jgi:hypothetical protein
MKFLSEIDRIGAILEMAPVSNFSMCAFEVLSSTPLYKYFSLDLLPELRLRHADIESKLEHPCVFSDECFLLYQGKEFSIELYHWLYSDTGIHDHNFRGAFQCISGENHQVEFHFEPESVVFEGLEKGKLVKASEEVLVPGSTQEIRNEDHFIHTVCHAPSTFNLCIRTKAEKAQVLNAYHVDGYRYALKKNVELDTSDLSDLSSNELLHLFHMPSTKTDVQKTIDTLLSKRHDISYMSYMQETSKFLNDLGRVAKNY